MAEAEAIGTGEAPEFFLVTEGDFVVRVFGARSEVPDIARDFIGDRQNGQPRSTLGLTVVDTCVDEGNIKAAWSREPTFMPVDHSRPTHVNGEDFASVKPKRSRRAGDRLIQGEFIRGAIFGPADEENRKVITGYVISPYYPRDYPPKPT